MKNVKCVFFQQTANDDLKEKSSSPYDKSEDNGNGGSQNGLDQQENGFRYVHSTLDVDRVSASCVTTYSILKTFWWSEKVLDNFNREGAGAKT
jgi:hypothetical protein